MVRVVGAAAVVGVLAGCIRFDAPTTHPVPLAPTETVRSVLTGDVTGDGMGDVIVAVRTPQYSSRATRVMISCGTGCTTPGTLIEGWRPTKVADLDGDGIDDVLVSSVSFYQGNARIYFGGRASGDRPAGLAPDDWAPLPASWDYTTGDLDGDGDLDLVQSTTFAGYYLEHRQLRNDGTGTFTDAGQLGYSGALNVGGGGVLVVGVGGRDHVYTKWLGEWTATDASAPSPPPPDTLTVADVDGDGIDDLVLSTDDDLLTFSRGTGTGFTPFPDYQTIEVPRLVAWHVGDLDADGNVDLVLFDEQRGTTMLGGSGDGGFPYEPTGTIPPGRVTFGDLDGDGLPEAIDITADALGLEIYPNTAIT